MSFAPLPQSAAEAQELESKHCLHVDLEFVMDLYFHRRLLDTRLVLGFELIKNNRKCWLHDSQKLLLLLLERFMLRIFPRRWLVQ
jgi:hypothetical protein